MIVCVESKPAITVALTGSALGDYSLVMQVHWLLTFVSASSADQTSLVCRWLSVREKKRNKTLSNLYILTLFATTSMSKSSKVGLGV